VRYYGLILSAAFLAIAASLAAQPAKRSLIAPQVAVRVPVAPTVFKADGAWHLVYELRLANMSPADCQVSRVEVLSDGPGARVLDAYDGARLDSAIAHPGQPKVKDKSQLAPGTVATVYIWTTVDKLDAVPAAIRQRLVVKVGDFAPDTILTRPTPVNRGAVAITPPLRGDHWLAGNGPSFTSGHRRALVVIDGSPAIGQRFAIDWVRLHDNGKTFQGDSLDNKNYLAYGSDALAVADGIVVETKDSIPQNIPGETSRAVPITLVTVGGNHVVLDIGGGHYAFYAHLQPGSLRVKLGDHVRRGQVVGLVGNSGNSTEPHLHFHVADGISPLGSEGLPYSLPSFQVVSHGWKALQRGVSEEHRDEIPVENEVVNFPAGSDH
jgi:murein DD-endopeptidase